MSSFQGHFSGVFLSNKSKIEELKQFFDCRGIKSAESWETPNNRISLKETGLDFITEDYIQDFELLNRLFGKTYVISGDYESDDTVDSEYEKIVRQDPFEMQEYFSLKDYCYGDECAFSEGTPYYDYSKTIQELAAEEGIEEQWSVLEQDDDWFDEDRMVIPDPDADEFCSFCEKYVTYFDSDEGEAQGKFPIVFGKLKNASVKKLIPIATEKGYDKLVVLLNEYLEGKTHESEGEERYRGRI